MSYYRHIYHIITRTKLSIRSIPEKETAKRLLFTYILRICQENGWYLHRINSHYDHMHILIELPGNVMPTEAMQKIKANTSRVFRRNSELPIFDGWANGFASFTVSYYEAKHISNYIASQAEHHKVKSFADELQELFKQHGVTSDHLNKFLAD